MIDVQGMQKFRSAAYVRGLLMSYEPIQALVQSKIFPVVAPLNTPGEHIEVLRTKLQRGISKMGIYEEVCSVSVIAWSRDYDKALEIIEQADACLQRALSPDYCGWGVELSNASEGFIDDKYFQEIELIIH